MKSTQRACAELLVTYFGNNAYPIRHPEVAAEYQADLTHYNLDAIHNLEQSLAEGLPTDPEAAEAEANARLDQLDPDLTNRMFDGLAYSLQWQVRKIPAFVFGDGEYVIYGVTDTATALRHYFRSRKVR